jgi:chlorobactene glucosyltransferase
VESRGEILVFTDADVRWEPHALSSVAAMQENTRAGMLTVWPTQVTATWSERLVVPLIMQVLLGYLPEILVRFVPWPIFAAANGQCLVFERAAYGGLGGHLQVKGAIVEDVALARAAKSTGARLVMALGRDFIRTRMYSHWREVREGFGKNILAGHGGQPGLLILSALLHWFLYVAPWIWLLGWALSGTAGWPVFPLLMIGLGLAGRLTTAGVSGQRVQDAFLMPLSVLLMTVIAAQALWWHYRQGGPRWKGRTLLREA